MPTTATISSPIIITPTGGSVGFVSGATGIAFPITFDVLPIQLCGFVPLTSCTLEECRTFVGDCYVNPVFGKVNQITSTYENDMSTFFINDSLRRATEFVLQKLDTRLNVWEDVAIIGNTVSTIYDHTYGSFYRFGFFPSQIKYCGVQINWGYVLTNDGAGIYKLVVRTPAIYWSRTPSPYCVQSEPFVLNPFDCDRAHGTVKFEAYQSGKIGSIDTDGYVFNLCNIRLYDSIRQKGFFGYETTAYDEILLEYQNGLIDRVRDEAIQKFNWFSKPMPKYIHDRFKAYGMMGDSLFVSDYNKNNSDYSIKRKSIVKASGFEPTYYMGTRLSTVKTEFKEGIQGVIKSTSCEVTNRQ